MGIRPQRASRLLRSARRNVEIRVVSRRGRSRRWDVRRKNADRLERLRFDDDSAPARQRHSIGPIFRRELPMRSQDEPRLGQAATKALDDELEIAHRPARQPLPIERMRSHLAPPWESASAAAFNRSAPSAVAGLAAVARAATPGLIPARAKRWPSFSSTIATPIATRQMPSMTLIRTEISAWRRSSYGPRRRRPATNETTNSTRNTKNRNLAISAAPTAMPPKPKSAATSAITKNTAA